MSRWGEGSGSRAGVWVRLAACLLIAGLAVSAPAPAEAAAAGTPLYPCDNQRIGFGVTGNIGSYDVSGLRAGWYVNWGAAPRALHPAGLDFVQIIRVNNYGYWPAGNDLNAILDRSPASLWLIGNEPDAPLQDSTDPEKYAAIYRDAYKAIKERDPLARVAIGGVVQATPLRMKWLDRVWNEYQRLYGEPMPVDVWNLHTFLLREVRPGYGEVCAPPGAAEKGDWGAQIPPGLSENCGLWVEINQIDRLDLFKEQVIRFRTWMRNRGQQNKELIVSEYGILFPAEYGYSYTRVRDYMFNTFQYFLDARDTTLGYPADDYHLVQRWAWYSLDDTSFEDAGTTYSALLNPKTGVLTALGRDFARFAQEKASTCAPYVDLFPVRLQVTTPSPIRYGQTGTVRIELEVSNSGTAAAPATQAQVWQGDPAAGGTLLGVVNLASVPARFGGTAKATYDWTVSARGSRTITVRLDATDKVAESREDNNLVATTLSFGTVNLAAGPARWELLRGPLRPAGSARILLAETPVLVAQPAAPSRGIQVLPPSFKATWYDGNPDSGGTVIATRSMAAPAAFGATVQVPRQEWTPGTAGGRTVWLVVALDTDAPETSLSDNRSSANIPGTADFALVQAEVLGGAALAADGIAVDVQLRFRVTNLGVLPPAGPLTVAVWPGEAPSGPEIGRVALAATGDWTEPLTWAGLSPGLYPYLARVDPDGIEPESNEANNDLRGNVLVAVTRRYLPFARR